MPAGSCRSIPTAARPARRTGTPPAALRTTASSQAGWAALALEVGGDRVEVAAGRLDLAKGLFGRGVRGVEGPCGAAVVGEGAQGALRHGVDDAGGNQPLDVQHVGIGGILGARTRP